MSPSLFQSPLPDVAIEIDSTHVAAARVAWGASTATVGAHASEPLRAGLVTPALAAPNIADVGEVSRAIAQVLSRLGGRTRRVALVIPDTAAKVSLLKFETVPARTADLQELVRWQIRKSAPFPVEQAVVSFTAGARPADGGQEFVVTLARQDIVQQYEDACDGAGVHAGLVDISTFSVINHALGTLPAGGDWLLVHAAASYATLSVLRGGDLIFFRNRTEDAEGTLADVVHQTAMYYEDRLQGAGFDRVLLAVSPAGATASDALRHSLQDRLGLEVQAFEPSAHATLAGILMRERTPARQPRAPGTPGEAA
jgi:type IV pilus assembly protein PilM